MNKDRRDFADYVYKVDTLNAIFAISSVMLVLTVVWMIWDDYDREWKMLQREANALAIEKTKAELEAAQQEMDQDQLAGIQAEMDEVEETLRAQQERLDGARMALRDLAVAWYSADQNARFAKAEYDVIKYEYETANHRGRRKEAATKKEALDAMAIRIDALRRTKEEVEAKRSARQQVLDGATREQRELEGQRELLLHKAGLLRRKLDKIEPSLANRLRNMPMVYP